MRLAQSSEVVALLGIGDDAGTRGTAGAALDATGPAVAEKLGTGLEAATYQDYFSYNPPKYRTYFCPDIFRLAAGFVDPDSFVLRMGDGVTPLTAPDQGTVLTTDYYILDTERGLVTLLKPVSVGAFTLCAAYDAGFVKDGDTGALQGLPEWLKQAGVTAAVKMVRTSPANLAKGKTAAYKDIQNAMYGEVSMIVNPHIRPRMGLLWPDRSLTEV